MRHHPIKVVINSPKYNIPSRLLRLFRGKPTKQSVSEESNFTDATFNHFKSKFLANSSDWCIVGIRNDRKGNMYKQKILKNNFLSGEFWNPEKINLLQRYLENNFFVPDDYVSMREILDKIGQWVTKEKIQKAGYKMVKGKKRTHAGSLGYFVEPAFLEHAKMNYKPSKC